MSQAKPRYSAEKGWAKNHQTSISAKFKYKLENLKVYITDRY